MGLGESSGVGPCTGEGGAVNVTCSIIHVVEGGLVQYFMQIV